MRVSGGAVESQASSPMPNHAGLNGQSGRVLSGTGGTATHRIQWPTLIPA
jgi:hypothetical protein